MLVFGASGTQSVAEWGELRIPEEVCPHRPACCIPRVRAVARGACSATLTCRGVTEAAPAILKCKVCHKSRVTTGFVPAREGVCVSVSSVRHFVEADLGQGEDGCCGALKGEVPLCARGQPVTQ